MTIAVRVPPLGESGPGAKLANWLKREGDRVREGEVLAEIETDKTMVELESPAAGVLSAIMSPDGTSDLEAGTVLALIEEDERHTAADAIRATPQPSAAPPRIETTSALPSIAPSGPDSPLRMDNAKNATPLAQHMAGIAGVDLAQIRTTSERVTKADVERFLAGSSAAPIAVESAPFDEPPVSAVRRITATRLLQAKQSIPHFYLQTDCNVGELLQLRDRVRQQGATVPTVTDFAVRAAALALGKVPRANSSWVNDTLRIYRDADIAVAVNTPNGLITPIVRAANRKPVADISGELRGLIDRARAGRLKPDEYTGGTFTISNLGMLGVTALYAIINPPQSGILGIGAIEQRAVVRNGQIEIGAVMTCTLSADHRAMDGATGAEFLMEFRHLMEDPSKW